MHNCNIGKSYKIIYIKVEAIFSKAMTLCQIYILMFSIILGKFIKLYYSYIIILLIILGTTIKLYRNYILLFQTALQKVR